MPTSVGKLRTSQPSTTYPSDSKSTTHLAPAANTRTATKNPPIPTLNVPSHAEAYSAPHFRIVQRSYRINVTSTEKTRRLNKDEVSSSAAACDPSQFAALGKPWDRNHKTVHGSMARHTYRAAQYLVHRVDCAAGAKHDPVTQARVHSAPTQIMHASNFHELAISKVRNSAEQFNGKCTWSFSQSAPEIKKILQQEKNSSKGICEMLAALWIERRVKGSSLEQYLQDHSGKIDLDKIRQIQQLHIAGKTLNPGAMVEDKNSLGYISERVALQEIQPYLASDKSAFFDFFTPVQRKSIHAAIYTSEKNGNAAIEQALDNLVGHLSDNQRIVLEMRLNKKLTQPKQAQATETWLQAKNIDTINKLSHKQDSNQIDFYQQMARAIIDKALPNQADDCYQLLAIQSYGQACWGHQTAILRNQEKIDFFDPNIGEFHFDKKTDFAAWWPVFLDLANYSSGQNKAPCNAYQIIFCVPQQ